MQRKVQKLFSGSQSPLRINAYTTLSSFLVKLCFLDRTNKMARKKKSFNNISAIVVFPYPYLSTSKKRKKKKKEKVF